MSTPSSGWGYDKDIAGSLSEISEHLCMLVMVLSDQVEANKAKQEEVLYPPESLRSFGDLTHEILADPTLGIIDKHTLLRKMADRMQRMGQEFNDGKAKQVQTALEKDTKEGKV